MSAAVASQDWDPYINQTFDFVTTGHRKVTLWPALLSGPDGVSVYPKVQSLHGYIVALFDTRVERTLVPLAVDAGNLTLSQPYADWAGSPLGYGFRWGFTIPSGSGASALRLRHEQLYAPWTGSGQIKKWFSADGEACGTDYEWEF